MSDWLDTHEKVIEVRYSTIKDSLKTGDILLFSGTELQSYWIRFCTSSPWSHVGMVIRTDQLPPLKNLTDKYGRHDPRLDEAHLGGLYLWHSNASSLCMPDMITDERKRGVQLNPLFRALKCYQGEIYLRRLTVPTYLNAADQCTPEFFNFMRRTAPKGYTSSNVVLCKAAYDGPCGQNTDDFTEYFCSQLQAHSYMEMGYMNRKLTASEFIPKDFSSMTDSPFLPGIQAGKEVRLILDAE